MNLDALSGLAARLRAIPSLGAEIAKEAAPGLLAANKATAAAGTSPDGKAWALTKQGKPALVNAANALTTRVVGDVVYLVLSGVNVFHNATRRILPFKGIDLPASFRAAVVSAAIRVLSRTP